MSPYLILIGSNTNGAVPVTLHVDGRMQYNSFPLVLKVNELNELDICSRFDPCLLVVQLDPDKTAASCPCSSKTGQYIPVNTFLDTNVMYREHLWDDFRSEEDFQRICAEIILRIFIPIFDGEDRGATDEQIYEVMRNSTTAALLEICVRCVPPNNPCPTIASIV